MARQSSGRWSILPSWPTASSNECDHDVLVMCGPNEREIAKDIVKLSGRPPGIFHGRSAVGSWHGQGVHSARATDGIHRQRSAARRGGVGGPVVTLYGPMLPDLERKSHAAGDQSGARLGLHRLSQASVPAGPSSLHERLDRGNRFRGGIEDDWKTVRSFRNRRAVRGRRPRKLSRPGTAFSRICWRPNENDSTQIRAASG